MKVALLSGLCAEGRCGVGDYSRILAAALGRKGVHVELLKGHTSTVSTLFCLNRELRKFQPNVIHLQYPTAGFGRGVTPQVLSLLTSSVLTVHEFEATHLLRRLSCYPLWLRAAHVIFTTESNMKCSARWAPWLAGKSSVVPLSSNIPINANGHHQREMAEVLYFGLLRPNKGIEDVLEFTRLAQAISVPLKVRIVGSAPEQDLDYLHALRSKASGLPIAWDFDLSAEEVAQKLARTTIAYLPFPDGASERRTSLLAALGNGVSVITTRGKFTPSDLEGAVCFSSSAAGALAAAQTLLQSPAQRDELASKGRDYAAKFSWDAIADSHIAIYKQLVSNR